MKIGFYDDDRSASSALCMEARRKGIKTEYYEEFPGEDADLPGKVFVSTHPQHGAEHYEEIRKSIAAHPDTQFFILLDQLVYGDSERPENVVPLNTSDLYDNIADLLKED